MVPGADEDTLWTGEEKHIACLISVLKLPIMTWPKLQVGKEN